MGPPRDTWPYNSYEYVLVNIAQNPSRQSCVCKKHALRHLLTGGRSDNIADIASVSPYGEAEAKLLVNPFQMFRVEGNFSLPTVPHVFVLTLLDYKFHTDSGLPKGCPPEASPEPEPESHEQ